MSLADLLTKSYTPVSDPDASVDSMVEAASQPSLSTLMQRAKDAGHITALVEYGHPVVA
jgi:hypothetical protein